MPNLPAQIGDIGPFDIFSLSWGPQHAPVVGPDGTTQAHSSDVVILKQTHANSAALFQASAGGTRFDFATITVISESGAVTVYQFSSVFIASYTIGGSSTSTDSMDWNFAPLSVAYDNQGNSGGQSGSWGGSLSQSGGS